MPEEDDHWFLVGGRRWRRTDPALPEDVVAALRSHLGSARATVGAASRRGDAAAVADARRRVGIAKHGLGERGPKWWDEPVPARVQRAGEALAELAG
ncbi:biopolymer transporter Tol [Amnibacterium kyonggiense]